MKTGFCLRQVDQILRDAFLFENTADHRIIASIPNQGPLENSMAAIREIVDVGSDRVGHHERQVGMREFDFGRGFRFHVGVDRRSGGVDLINRGRFGFLGGEIVGLLQVRQVETVHSRQEAVKLLLQARIGMNVLRAAHQQAEGVIETLSGGVRIPRLRLI